MSLDVVGEETESNFFYPVALLSELDRKCYTKNVKLYQNLSKKKSKALKKPHTKNRVIQEQEVNAKVS